MVTEVQSTVLWVLDPTGEVVSDAVARAPRVSTLAGQRVGLLGNAKLNATPFLDIIGDMLRERYGVGELVRMAKPRPSQIAPEQMLDELARSCDVVITAIGD